MIRKYKKIIVDMVLNICATALPLMILQLVIFPLIARKEGNESYGTILTVISLVTIVSGSLGNSLNNIRLIRNQDYEKEKICGDFQLLIFAEMIVSAIVVGISSIQYCLKFIDYIFVVIMAIIWTYREYAIVTFRIRLNFKGIVVNNLIMVLGYLLGLFLYFLWGHWQIVYILGMSFSMAYIAKTSSIVSEKAKRTKYFFRIGKELVLLVIASVLVNLLNYADRMIIYPMIGATAVSVYYASTLFGKIVSSAVAPINAVILSYISQKEFVSKKLMLIVIGSASVTAVVGYKLCILLAHPALQLLYPDWIDASMYYVPIMTAVAMITMISSVLNPFILKFCSMKWQLVINFSVLCCYVGLALLLARVYGLMGFCVSVLVSNILKLGILIILGFNSSRQETVK